MDAGTPSSPLTEEDFPSTPPPSSPAKSGESIKTPTSTGCSRQGCGCKGFSPNIFDPKYCSFCIHLVHLHYPLPESAPQSPRSTTSGGVNTRSSLPSIFIHQNLNAGLLSPRSSTQTSPNSIYSRSTTSLPPAPKDSGATLKRTSSSTLNTPPSPRRASFPVSTHLDEKPSPRPIAVAPTGIQTRSRSESDSALPPSELVSTTKQFISSTNASPGAKHGLSSASHNVALPKLSLRDIVSSGDKNHKGKIPPAGNKGMPPPPSPSTKSNNTNYTLRQFEDYDDVPPPLRRHSLNLAEGIASARGGSRVEDFYFKGTQQDSPARMVRKVEGEGEEAWQEQLGHLRAKMKRLQGSEKKMRKKKTAQMTELKSSVSLLRQQMMEVYSIAEKEHVFQGVPQEPFSRTKKESGSGREDEEREKSRGGGGGFVAAEKEKIEKARAKGRLWKKNKNEKKTSERKNREAFEREESLRQLREWRMDEERKARQQEREQQVQQQQLQLKLSSDGGSSSNEDSGDGSKEDSGRKLSMSGGLSESDKLKALREQVASLSSKIQKMKNDERDQNQKKLKKISDLEAKVDNLSRMMSALKRQTNKEVDQLKAELEQTKRTNLDVIEKGLREEEYSSLAAVATELNNKAIVDSEVKETLRTLLLSLSSERIPLKRRITISFTVDAEKQGGLQDKDEDDELPELPPKPDPQEFRATAGEMSNETRGRSQTVGLTMSSPPGVGRSKKSNSTNNNITTTSSTPNNTKRKVHPMLGSQDKGLGKKSSKFLLQMRSPRVKEKAKRFSARVTGLDCCMGTLPDTLLNLIIGCLDGKTLVRLGCVSAHFRTLCNNEGVWENLYKRSQIQHSIAKQAVLRRVNVLLMDNKSPRTARLSISKSPRGGEDASSPGPEIDVDIDGFEDDVSTTNPPEDPQVDEKAGALSWKLKYRALVVAGRRDKAVLQFLSEELAKEKEIEDDGIPELRDRENDEEEDMDLREKVMEKEREKERDDFGGWHARVHFMTVKGRNTQPQFSVIARKAIGSKAAVAGETAPLRILMFSTSEDADGPIRVPYVVTRSTDGRRHEPAYHCNIVNYGKCDALLDIACEPDVYYSLINYTISNYRQYVSHTFYTVVLCPPEWVIEIGVRKPWPYVLSIKGEWNEETSGGCLNEETFEDNTFYLLTLPKSVPRHAHLPLCIMLEQKSRTNQPEVPGQIIPYPYYIGFYVFNAELTEQIPLQVKWKNCHKVHTSFTLDSKRNRKIMIVPTTFKAGQETAFVLHVYCDYQLNLETYEGEE